MVYYYYYEKATLSPKSMPPTNDEHEQVKAVAPNEQDRHKPEPPLAVAPNERTGTNLTPP